MNKRRNTRSRSRHIPRKVAAKLLEDARYRCCVCRVLIDPERLDSDGLFGPLEKQHIHTFSEDGGRTYDNLLLVCADCHAQIHKHPEKYPVDELRKKKSHWVGMRDVVPSELGMTDEADDAVRIPLSVESLNLHYLISASPQMIVSELALFVGGKVLEPLGKYDDRDSWLDPEKVALALRSAPRKHLDPGLALGELHLTPDDVLIALVPKIVLPMIIPSTLKASTSQEAGTTEEESQAQESRAQPRERRHPLEPLMVIIPAGKFWMGTDRLALELAGLTWQDWMKPETPYHQVYLPTYGISRYPVTNAEYARFVEATGHGPPPHWEGRHPPRGSDHPVVRITWHDAMAYCRWLSEVTGGSFRLPSEAEWEKAARGSDGRLWPWGNSWDPARCNAQRTLDSTTPVGQYSTKGDSLYGVADMAGNVWEWCSSLYGPYPYDPDDGREDPEAEGRRVLRGGSWNSRLQYYARCAYRARHDPDLCYDDIGFRCTKCSR
jgi:formylglycine-generating enzyme required for sulfatase activity